MRSLGRLTSTPRLRKFHQTTHLGDRAFTHRTCTRPSAQIAHSRSSPLSLCAEKGHAALLTELLSKPCSHTFVKVFARQEVAERTIPSQQMFYSAIPHASTREHDVEPEGSAMLFQMFVLHLPGRSHTPLGGRRASSTCGTIPANCTFLILPGCLTPKPVHAQA